MYSYIFELKKMVKKGGGNLVILTALLAALAQAFVLSSSNQVDSLASADFSTYSVKFISLFSGNHDNWLDNFYESIHPSPGRAHLWDQIDQYPNLAGEEIPRDVFYQFVEEAIALDGLTLTPEETQALDYAKEMADYHQAQLEADPDYQPRGLVTGLMTGDGILYGLLPILVVALVMVGQLGADWDQGTHVFQRTLTVRRSQVLLTIFGAGLTLLVAYLFFMGVFSAGIQVLTGQGLGDWTYPYRTLDWDQAFLPAYAIWLGIVLIFFCKSFLILSWALLLACWIRSRFTSYILTVFFLLLARLLTGILPSLQANWNPFYMGTQGQIMGQIIIDRSQGLQDRLVLAGDPMTGQVLGAWMLLGMLGVGLAIYAYQQNGLGVQKKYWPGGPLGYRRLKNTGFGFEWHKASHFISRPVLVLILASLFLGLFMSIRQGDQAHRDRGLISSHVDLNLGPVLDMFEDRREATETIPESLQEDWRFMAILEDIAYQTDQVLPDLRSLDQALAGKEEAFVQGDSARYYAQFEPELKVFFNPKGHYDSVDTIVYHPRPGYYVNGDFPTLYGYQLSLDRLQAFQDRGIRPLMGAGLTPTVYDRAQSWSDQVADHFHHQLRDRSALGLWMGLVSTYRLDLVFIALVALVCGSGYSLEGRGEGRDSLAWVYTLPQARTRLVTYKLAASLGLMGLILLAMVGVVLVYGFYQDGWGQWRTPLVQYLEPLDLSRPVQDFQETYRFQDLGMYNLRSLAYMALAGAFIVQLSLCLSTFFSQPGRVLALTLATCLLGYLVVAWPDNSLASWLPFAYLNIAHVLDGSILFGTGIQVLGDLQGLLVLLAWTLALYGLTRLRVRCAHLI